MLDFNNKMSRAQFFDQAWYGGSPYAQWQAQWSINDNNQRRPAFIAGQQLPLYGNPPTNVFNPMIDNFNEQYQAYVDLFDQKAENELLAQQTQANQAARVAELQVQSTQRINSLQSASSDQIAAIKADAAAESERVEQAGNVAARSLRIMGRKQPKAPTAQQTKRGARARGARTSAANYSRGSASTRGTNLSI